MTKKYALVIGNSAYQYKEDWPELPTAEQDATAVADLLRNPAIGAFDDVQLVHNGTSAEIRLAVARLFDRPELKKDDLVLLYFSGHGDLTDDDRLFFVGENTQHRYIKGSGLEAGYISGLLEDCRSQRKVVILDCCYSGRFGRSGGAKLPTKDVLGGTGRYILTSSRETQRSWEGNEIDNTLENGFFTYFLLEGLKTGRADLDGDGWVDIGELYEFIRQEMAERSAKQTPTQDFRGEGLVVLTRTPTTPEQRAHERLEAKLDEADTALEKRAYDRAVLLLNEVVDDELASSFFVQTATEMLNEVLFEQKRDEAYRFAMRRVERGGRSGQIAWRNFTKEYPDYDPDDLATKLAQPARRSGRVVAPKAVTQKSILPAPFAWIEIPNKGYSLSKYPVTNGQFKLFVDGGGYNEQKWWTTQGWDYRQNKNWAEPRYWQDEKWNGLLQPVVGVNWFEAVAFCHWLSEKSGQKIMLPTEDQWQYGAQGDDGRAYPWGNDWDGTRCQNSVKPQKSDRTSDVTFYEGNGDSPFGVVDMAGNVWEWCLTDYEAKTNDVNSHASKRVLRGGSWNLGNTVVFRVSFRNGYDPLDGNSNVCFRLALSS